MSTSSSDAVFAGSVPKLYQTYLVPLIFDQYAGDMADRVATARPTRVLEIAAGTGALSRELAAALPSNASIIATDLNPAMLDEAASIGATREIAWRQADAMRLPFADGAFDAVVCQFGAMFFPDKPRAFAEALRVLCPGGTFCFSVWDCIAENEFADVVTTALEDVFRNDPPRFLARTPHGYFDCDAIKRDLADAGFGALPRIATVSARSRAASPDIPAMAYCQGTPLRGEIEARDPARLPEATRTAAAAIGRRFGCDAVDGKIQAHVVTVKR